MSRPTVKIRIFIADDHPIVRQGLRRIVEADPGMAIAGEAGDVPTLLSALQSTATDLVLLDVSVRRAGAAIVLGVEDNGVGFTPQSLSGLRSLGLVGIRERALACGGTLTIRGEPGQGTGIAVTIPVAAS